NPSALLPPHVAGLTKQRRRHFTPAASDCVIQESRPIHCQAPGTERETASTPAARAKADEVIGKVVKQPPADSWREQVVTESLVDPVPVSQDVVQELCRISLKPDCAP